MAVAKKERKGVEQELKVDHDLKCWPRFFSAISERRKKHDLRRCDDREFKVGDLIRLREFEPDRGVYTGREQIVKITYITALQYPCALSGEALHPDFCILSIATEGE